MNSNDTTDDIDSIDPPERLDVSGYKTAAGAAKATAKALGEWAEFYGGSADEVVLKNPEETQAYTGDTSDGVWAVVWEAGPWQWAPALTGGAWLGWNEHGGASPPEVSGLLDGAGFHVECHYSFDILFYNL